MVAGMSVNLVFYLCKINKSDLYRKIMAFNLSNWVKIFIFAR